MTFATKEEAFDAMEATRAEWLAATRAIARQIGKSGAEITVNDVRKVAPSLPPEADPRVWGAVFTKSEWEATGFAASTRRVSHNRPVRLFRLRGVE